jgi:hypothetical protein
MNPPEWLTDPTYRNVYETARTRHAPDVPYEQWLDHWFGRAIVGSGYPWFANVPDTIFRPELAHGYALRLFKNSARDLEYYHDDQIGAGLWLLVGDGDIHVDWPDIPIEERQACLLATADLFRDLFATRCAPLLSSGAEDRPLINTSCYMWWEYMTHIAFPGDPHFGRMLDVCLEVMERTLAISNPACKEAALHGLGHIAGDNERARALIDGFIAEQADTGPDLLAYARAARTGCIQ